MARLLLILYVVVASVGNCVAQKHDYNWMAGYNSAGGFSGTYQHWLGISKLTFDLDSINITRDSLGINFDKSNTIMSDKDGNLLFYCNGVRVHNRLDEKIENGDSLAGGYFLYDLTSALALGMLYEQYHLVLPNPLYPDLYDVFYIFVDSITIAQGLSIDGKKILRATIDISANNGHGKIVNKDVTVIEYENNISVAAVKHANGKDWWIITNKTFTNCYNVLHYNGSQNISSAFQCGGGAEERGFSIAQRFSPDGSVFASVSASGGLSVFNFDRCNGQMQLKESVSIPELKDSMYWWPTGLEFSSNSGFVYVFCNYRIYQFDMQATNIAASRVTVAVFDKTHRCPFPQLFTYGQLAPDGKIYMNSGNTNFCIGVIDNPNGQGASCNFNDMAITLPTFISGLPYYPNYRLGALPGSPCDTLTGLNEPGRAEKEKIVKVFPSAATDYITVDYGFTDWNKGEVTMEITSQLGQVVHQQYLPMYSGFQKIDVTQFANGVYTAFIKRGTQVVATAKFAKQ